MHVYSVIITTHPFKFMCIYPKELDQHYAYELLLCQIGRYEKKAPCTQVSPKHNAHITHNLYSTPEYH